MVGPTAEKCCRVCGGRLRATPLTVGIRDWEYGVAGEWAHRRCLDCGVVQIDPFPTLENLEAAYDIDYHGYVSSDAKGIVYDSMYRVYGWLLRRGLARLLPERSSLLDVGCGNGSFLASLAELRPKRVDGVDFSDRAVELARERGIDAIKGVFVEFDGEPASYDAIFMNNYLEHTLDPRQELEHSLKLLRPGGWLIGELPNYRAVDRALFGRFWGGNHVPRHTFQFERKSLRDLLGVTGFVEVDLKCSVNTAHLVLSIQNFLQRSRSDLKNNPAIKAGRAWYNALLIAAFMPVYWPVALAGLGGHMAFRARKPTQSPLKA